MIGCRVQLGEAESEGEHYVEMYVLVVEVSHQNTSPDHPLLSTPLLITISPKVLHTQKLASMSMFLQQ